MSTSLKDPKTKVFLRKSLRRFLFIYVFLSSLWSRKSNAIKIFYGGARRGNIGGPLVKVKRLNKYFPENYINYNLIYLLSNAPYLSPSTLDLVKRRHIPIVLNQNGVYYSAWYQGNWEEQNKILSYSYHSADYVFWQSNFCKNAAEKFLGKRKKPGEILFNAVDLQKFYPSSNFTKRPFTFLITGKIAIHHNYRLSIVIDALETLIKENPNVHLNIAGWIEDKDYIYSIIKQKSLMEKISFLGTYKQVDAPTIYTSADAYVTMTYQDNCPSCVLEAMACGLPIIYSSSGGIPELVCEHSGIGLEVPENWEYVYYPQSDAVAEAMIRVMEKKNSMSQAARVRAEETFDIETWINRHNRIFKELLLKN